MVENVILNEKCYWKLKKVAFEENRVNVKQIYWSDLKIKRIKPIVKTIKLTVKEEIISTIKRPSNQISSQIEHYSKPWNKIKQKNK